MISDSWCLSVHSSLLESNNARPLSQRMCSLKVNVVTVADGRRGVRSSTAFVCLSVFSHDISKTESNLTHTRFTKSPGNSLILGSKGQRRKSRSTKSNAGVGLCTLASAGFF